ncbi:phosphoribosyltransferase [Chthoniobacter flavus Ellin428]|uniref:Phosphoribosyltransferase n=1 Tax=Chthoniobacter flavus Ellin428 TaxID=497964 RepID=B4D499_9BACT|nr:phosphoribosyltransferase [Chthoniobacter flavus]EDY18700.1 phosphoribosyltransferase [Chthoniobacter flavus Ellin428]TCO89061.1 putative phosphoribosyltransferase [Chthoniobacter flavus]
MDLIFHDRREAGRILASHLRNYTGREDVIVLGLARGGVPVAFEVARQIGVPLDVFVVRKLGVPGHEELAMGAIASGGVRVLNPSVMRCLNEPERALAASTLEQTRELTRREADYREGRSPLALRGQTAILVDDGLATGASMRAAIAALRQQGVARIVVAVPVAAPEICEEFEDEVDEFICASKPSYFHSVGEFYKDFSQTTDEEVRELLARAEADLKGK